MIEETIVDFLEKETGIRTETELPPNPPKEIIIVIKTGSGKTNFINRATIAVQSYGKSMYEAAQLNEEVKKAMENLITLPEISASRLNSDYEYTDTTTKKYRYQAVFDVVY